MGITLAIAASIASLSHAGQVDRQALAAVTDALCHRRVALLGEPGNHGSGATLAFKAALVRTLVDRCGYDTVLFEASRYEFLSFARHLRTRDATPAMLGAAVGGLWARDEEFAPLLSTLFAAARAGRVTLGGLDDQLGTRGALYANDVMPDELAAPLPAGRREVCRTRLRQRIYQDYPADAPYAPAERDALRACIAEMNRAVRPDALAAEHRAMLAAIGRLLARDLAPEPAQLAGRERSMFAAYRELTGGRAHRVIVWGATVHLARNSAGWAPLAGAPSLGVMIGRAYGSGAFSLGFSAYAGRYRYPGQGERMWAPAPPGSLEAMALPAGKAAAFVGAQKLAALAIRPARLFGEDFAAARWREALDGVVIFREDRPPTSGEQARAVASRRRAP